MVTKGKLFILLAAALYTVLYDVIIALNPVGIFTEKYIALVLALPIGAVIGVISYWIDRN